MGKDNALIVFFSLLWYFMLSMWSARQWLLIASLSHLNQSCYRLL